MSEVVCTKTPKQLINEIKNDKWATNIEILDQKVSKIIQGFKVSFHKALKLLSNDLYSKEGHFIFELIQNTDDNSYSCENPSLLLLLKKSGIVLCNNENGFQEKDVISICDVGNSTKSKIEGYIGEKGIGFKSCFRVTNEPMIVSNGFQFKFDISDKNNLLGYVVPHWIDDPTKIFPIEKFDKTNIYLPFNDNVDINQISNLLNDVNMETLMFLRKLKVIQIKNEILNKNVTYSYKKMNETDIILTSKVDNEDAHESYYKVVSTVLHKPKGLEEESRVDQFETKLLLAFPMNEYHESHSKDQLVFAYLPIREYGFKFLIQADFVLTSNREDIHDKKWNKWIRDSIVDGFIQSVDYFKLDEVLKFSWYSYIPLIGTLHKFFRSQEIEIQKKLISTKCILTKSEKWKKPYEVIHAKFGETDLVENEELLKYAGKEYIHPNLKISSEILAHLSISSFSILDLIKCLKNEEWVKSHDDEWFYKLYSFFGAHLSEVTDTNLKELQKLKIICLENDEIVSQSQDIFLPLKGYEYVDKSMKIIKNSCIKYQGVSNQDITDFFKKLEIQEASPEKILKNSILPLYRRNENIGITANLDHLLFIREYIDDFESEIGEIKEVIRLLSKEKLFKTPSSMYISKDYYFKEPDLMKLLPNGSFVSELYLDYSWKLRQQTISSITKEREIEKWREFFFKIEILMYPKIEMTTSTLSATESKKQKFGHYGAKVEDFNISNDLKTIFETSGYLGFEFVDYYWSYYKEKMEKKIYPEDGRVKNFGISKLIEDSSFLHFLKTRKLEATNKEIVEAHEMYYGSESLSYGQIWPFYQKKIENDDFLQYLEIQKTFSIPSLLKRLKNLKKSKLTKEQIYSQCFVIIKLISNFNTLEFETIEFVDHCTHNNKDVIFRSKKKKKENLKDAFTKDKLLFINNHWFYSNELFWTQDKTLFERSDIPALESLFNQHESNIKGFLISIGVMKERPLKDVVNVLKDIAIEFKDKELTQNARDNVLQIYYKIDECLESKREIDAINTSWLSKAIKEEPFIMTTKGMMNCTTKKVYLNDDNDLFTKFKDLVPFFDITNEQNKLQNLIRISKIPKISTSTEIQIQKDKNAKSDKTTTLRLKSLLQYIERYFYHTDYYSYEKFKSDNYFRELNKSFECKFTNEKIKTTYQINDFKIEKNSSVKYDSNSKILFIHEKSKSDNAILSEFSYLFDTSKQKEFKSFLFAIFFLDEEEYMKFIGIDPIPKQSKNYGLFDEESDEESVDIHDPSLYDAFKVESHGDQNLLERWNKEKKEKMKQTKEVQPKEKSIELPTNAKKLEQIGIQFIQPTPIIEESKPKPKPETQSPPKPQTILKVGENEFKYKFDESVLEEIEIKPKKKDSKNSKEKSGGERQQINPFRNIPTNEDSIFRPDEKTSIKIDQIGMKLALSFELNRMKKINSKATIFENKVKSTDVIFDVSTPDKISQARKNTFIDSFLKLLFAKGVSVQSVGFDILTLNPNTNKVDRVIELKSSKIMKSSVEISALEWKSAEILKDLFYLYFIGNVIDGNPSGYIFQRPVSLKYQTISHYIVDLRSAKELVKMKFPKVDFIIKGESQEEIDEIVKTPKTENESKKKLIDKFPKKSTPEPKPTKKIDSRTEIEIKKEVKRQKYSETKTPSKKNSEDNLPKIDKRLIPVDSKGNVSETNSKRIPKDYSREPIRIPKDQLKPDPKEKRNSKTSVSPKSEKKPLLIDSLPKDSSKKSEEKPKNKNQKIYHFSIGKDGSVKEIKDDKKKVDKPK
eukprot:gene6589-10752_t